MLIQHCTIIRDESYCEHHSTRNQNNSTITNKQKLEVLDIPIQVIKKLILLSYCTIFWVENRVSKFCRVHLCALKAKLSNKYIHIFLKSIVRYQCTFDYFLCGTYYIYSELWARSNNYVLNACSN